MSDSPRLPSADRALLIPAALLLVAVVTVQLPVTLYGGSPREFDFGLMQLLPLWLGLGGLALAALWGLSRLVPRHRQGHLAAALWAAALWVWFSGNVAVYRFGLLTGEPLEFGDKRRWAIPELVVAAAILFFAFRWVRRSSAMARKLAIAALVIVALQSALALIRDLPKRGALTHSPPPALARFAPTENVLVLLLDAFQSDVFAELTAVDEELAAKLDGFVLFANTLGTARTTALTMPAVHTGLRYEAGWTLDEYYSRARKRPSFLGKVARAGYEVTVVSPFGFCPPGGEWCGELDRITGSPWLDLWTETTLPLDLSLFRVAPLVLKRPIYGRGRWLLLRALKVHPGRQQQARSFELLRGLAERAHVSPGRPTTKFLHLPTPHTPLVTTANCTLLDEVQPVERMHMLHQSRCALELTADLVERLRALDIFDSALIVLMADHGTGLPSSTARGEVDDEWRRRIGAANPLLAVKLPGAEGPLGVSRQPAKIDDVGITVCQAVPGCRYGAGRPLTFRGGPDRPREFLDYRWRTDFWYEKGRIDVTRWEVRGPLRRRESWRLADD